MVNPPATVELLEADFYLSAHMTKATETLTMVAQRPLSKATTAKVNRARQTRVTAVPNTATGATVSLDLSSLYFGGLVDPN